MQPGVRRSCADQRGHALRMDFDGAGDAVNLGTTLARARENWFPAKPLHEGRGRRPKRLKHARFRSQQQRAFAAGIMHSIGVYVDCLGPHKNEIHAMLYARNLIDPDTPSCCHHGVRPPEKSTRPNEAQDEVVHEAQDERVPGAACEVAAAAVVLFLARRAKLAMPGRAESKSVLSCAAVTRTRSPGTQRVRTKQGS